jgi:hypothetical protein
MIVTGYHRVLFAKAATEQAFLLSQANKSGANVLEVIDISNGVHILNRLWLHQHYYRYDDTIPLKYCTVTLVNLLFSLMYRKTHHNQTSRDQETDLASQAQLENM